VLQMDSNNPVHLTKDPARFIKHRLEENPEGITETDLWGMYVEEATSYESGQRLNPEDLRALYHEFSGALDNLVYSDDIEGRHIAESGEKKTVYQLQPLAEDESPPISTAGEERVEGVDVPNGYDEFGERVEREEESLFQDEFSRDVVWEE
ncbi:MAG: hypothetical protein SVS85_02150, partial [Candidatus Nanohaloarchaea archaeon]|nr:hypothetical protein [Candidatus Nanohaloarchaea archaeon]